MTPKSGRIIKNDGSTVNIADILGGEPVTGKIKICHIKYIKNKEG